MLNVAVEKGVLMSSRGLSPIDGKLQGEAYSNNGGKALVRWNRWIERVEIRSLSVEWMIIMIVFEDWRVWWVYIGVLF